MQQIEVNTSPMETPNPPPLPERYRPQRAIVQPGPNCMTGGPDDGASGPDLLSPAQRAGDCFLSAVGLLLLMPFLAVVALLIRLDSPGPVLFTQTRIGKDGREFPFYKFRSMVRNAEAIREHVAAGNERTGPVFKMKDDPRITRVGRPLRRYSVDELPQLLNVLKGDMSLIGPRPALPHEVAQYTDHERERLRVKPGVTGLWQVSGRARLSFAESIKLDLYYIAHRSLRLNLWILWRTLPAVLGADGAY